MKKTKRLSLRKEPTQSRSIQLRGAILEAATYILRHHGARGFTTNKVAEKAGVNIASLYQYYPNKDALLFHLIELEWTSTFDSVYPILMDSSKPHATRLRLFIERFYETEMDESYLHEAIAASGLDIEATIEYKMLTSRADEVFRQFLTGALPSTTDLKKTSEFMQTVISSYSESKASEPWPAMRFEARTMAAMLCGHFRISNDLSE